MLWGLVMSVFGFQQSYLYSLGGAIIFSLYILYDTSQLMNHLVRRRGASSGALPSCFAVPAAAAAAAAAAVASVVIVLVMLVLVLLLRLMCPCRRRCCFYCGGGGGGGDMRRRHRCCCRLRASQDFFWHSTRTSPTNNGTP